MSEPRRRGRPVGGGRISAAQIVDAAMRIADADGVEAVTMRRLGEVLDVDPMAVYRHMDNRDAVLDALVEAVFRDAARRAARLPAGDGWRPRTERIAKAQRRALLAHPNLLPLIAARPTRTPYGFDAIDRWLDVLVAAGFDAVTALDAITVVTTFTVGQTLADVAGGPPDERRRRRAEIRSLVDPQRTPHVAAALSGRPRSREARFESGLRALLDGYERRR